MKADPFVQLRLLQLQEFDSTLDRLAHKRRTLPEIAEIAGHQERLATLDTEQIEAETDLEDLGRAQRKLEADIDVVRQRKTRDQKRLDDGTIGSSKELEGLQGEIASLERRQGVLEDEELELMQQAEDAQKRLDVALAEITEVSGHRDAAAERKSAAETEIDTQAATATTQRGELAPTLPEDLMKLYERQRSANGGVGAAALVRRRCEGCHLELAGAELAAVRAAASDEVLRCESCGRVLVRTEESGL